MSARDWLLDARAGGRLALAARNGALIGLLVAVLPPASRGRDMG